MKPKTLEPCKYFDYAFKWLVGFTVVSTLVAIVGPFMGEKGMRFALLLPFVHSFVFLGVYFVRGLFVSMWGVQVESYLKENHREICDLVQPWPGGFLGRTVWPSEYSRLWGLYWGRYTNGTDEVLELIFSSTG